jgi:predicted DNA-binding transcriptional regulator AlpA
MTQSLANALARTAEYAPAVEHLLTYNDVMAATKLGRSTIHRMAMRGAFPRPLHIAGRARWRASEVSQRLAAPTEA